MDRGRRDGDAFDRAMRFRLLAWSMVGALLGLLAGVLMWTGGGSPWLIPPLTLLSWGVAYFGPLLVLRGAARVASTLYVPSGRSTPRKREFSQAEAHVARGEHRAAIEVFEEAIADDPDDPRPYLRVARLHRDRLDAPEAAARWFKRALGESRMSRAMRLLVLKECVELYEVRLRAPRRAAPLLARIAHEARGSAEGEWAAARLAEIKEGMAAEEDRR